MAGPRLILPSALPLPAPSDALAPPHEAARDGNLIALRKRSHDKGNVILNVKDDNGWIPRRRHSSPARVCPSPPTRRRVSARRHASHMYAG